MKIMKTFDVTAEQYKQIVATDKRIMRWNYYYKRHFNDADICRKFDRFTQSLPIDTDLFEQFYQYEGIYEVDYEPLDRFFNYFTVDGMNDDDANMMIYVPSYVTLAVRKWRIRIAE